MSAQLQQPTQSQLEQNKREMFDGMRAYHESEISHANNAITMLLAIAGGAGAVVLAILFPHDPPAHIREIAFGLFLFVLLLGLIVAWSTHSKISADHARYAEFGAEYVATSKLLGFYSSGLKTHENIGQGKGYRKTQIIIWAFASALICLTLGFDFYTPLLSRVAPDQIEIAKKCQMRGGVWINNQCVIKIE